MIRVGTGFDAHRFAAGRALVMGGVSIKHDMGLEGHSDADVLCHAMADALLGAIADGDIGKHFPNTDAAWKDARSLEMLGIVAGRVRARGGRICNIDSTIIAERPRMAEHIDEMRSNIANALNIRSSNVSVKATTVEGMGALGRGEGIAAMASAVVEMRE